MRTQSKTPLKSLKTISARESWIVAPMMPRNASLSQSCTSAVCVLHWRISKWKKKIEKLILNLVKTNQICIAINRKIVIIMQIWVWFNKVRNQFFWICKKKVGPTFSLLFFLPTRPRPLGNYEFWKCLPTKKICKNTIYTFWKII